MVLTSSTDSSEDEYLVQIRRRRIIKPRINFTFNENDRVFIERFRVSKTTVEYLLNRIGQQLQHTTRRNNPLTPLQQILCALHWMGCGSQYHVIADAHGVSKVTVHRCIKRVCDLITSELFGEEVRWPDNCNDIPRRFMANNIPRIAGIVDGSLIEMDAPRQNELAFVDRNGNHSMNVMIVCGPNLEVLYASARWPGSVHDARVMRCSSLARKWESGWRPFPNAILMGDSGYGLKKWLMTPRIPVQIPRTASLERFLRAFRSTRRMVENALGIIKEKFPCLNYMRLQPIIASKIILSCITLHNIEKRLGSEFYVPYDDNAVQANNSNNNNVDNNNLVEYDNAMDALDEEVIETEAIETLQSLIQLFD